MKAEHARHTLSKRLPVKVMERREKIAELYIGGLPMHLVAKQVGCSLATVSRDLSALEEQWVNRSLGNINAIMRGELKKLNRLENEYWDAWERSKQRALSETVRSDKKGKSVERTRRRQVGDPRFLAGIERVIKQRCELLGLEAPKEHRHAGSDQSDTPIKVDAETLDVHRSALARQMARLAKVAGNDGEKVRDRPSWYSKIPPD